MSLLSDLAPTPVPAIAPTLLHSPSATPKVSGSMPGAQPATTDPNASASGGGLGQIQDTLQQNLARLAVSPQTQMPGDVSRPSLNPIVGQAGGNMAGRVHVLNKVADRIASYRGFNGSPVRRGGRGSVLDIARTQDGVPYVWADSDPAGGPSAGFDCSGLTSWVYGHFGVQLPHLSSAQSQMFPKLKSSQLQPGDLVFFHYSDRNGPGAADHVGIYAGNNRVYAASSDHVGYYPMDWDHFMWGGRPPIGGNGNRSQGPTPNRRRRTGGRGSTQQR